jgi:hypothetical protein
MDARTYRKAIGRNIWHFCFDCSTCPRKTTSRLLTGGPLKMASYVENASFVTGPTIANAIAIPRLAETEILTGVVA